MDTHVNGRPLNHRHYETQIKNVSPFNPCDTKFLWAKIKKRTDGTKIDHDNAWRQRPEKIN